MFSRRPASKLLARRATASRCCDSPPKLRPDLAIVDVRMPPTYTTEGIDTAEQIRSRYPGTGVLVLTQDLQGHHAARLQAGGPSVAYLLKEDVTNLQEFAEIARRVASGTRHEFKPALEVL